MDLPASPSVRGSRRGLDLRPRRILYAENGSRSVAVETTLAEIERSCLSSDREIQFRLDREQGGKPIHALLKLHSPEGPDRDERFFGKGTTRAQTVASACLELFERQCAKQRPDDFLEEASYAAVAAEARDPRLFVLAADGAFRPEAPIDWVWGYSLTRSETVRVPANLVYLPYDADRDGKIIAWNGSNGLASGNNLEEAVLHGILEVIERDAAMIDEYNGLRRDAVATRGLSPGTVDLLAALEARGFGCSFRSAATDMPFPVVSAFLQKADDPAHCSAAYGCHLDPRLAISRALTEAVQVLPPSVNQEGWFRSGAAARHAAPASRVLAPGALRNLSSGELLADIRTCVDILNDFGSEVIVVDLSLPDIPFPAVRVLATGLQPLLHDGHRRLSSRFFEVPVKLGLRAEPLDPADVKVWPLCGYR